ncbi:MAG: tetratricopeptide repeat protein [Desulfuromonadaceae bacterium]|nr:tetratricopeptide repeat protein [Desulfuromonadaceae bacterium]
MDVLFQNRKINLYLLFAIVAVTIVVFSPVLWHEFVNLDDSVVVYENPHVWYGVTVAAVRWAFTSDFISNWVPLTMLSHMLDVQIFGMNPAGHHAVNVLLHVASSVLLFLLLNRATGSPLQSSAVAFLFALHPLQIESVAWVAERKDVLSAFFWMLTLYAYVSYSSKPCGVRYLTVLGFFILGLLSKPMVVTLPVVLLLLDWWPLGRLAPDREGKSAFPSRFVGLCVEKIPFFVLSACLSVITYLVKQKQGEIVTDHSFMERVARAFISYGEYLRKMVWPSKLAVYYPASETLPSTIQAVFALLLFLLITTLVCIARKRSPFLLVGWIWYVVALLPVIGLIQSGACTFADRYTYLPGIGLFVMAVWGGSQLMERWHTQREVIAILSVVVLGGMIMVTSLQLRHWKNSFTLLSHAIEVTDNNWLALNNLGQAYLNAGRVDDALWYFNESVKNRPTYVIALINLGALLSVKNRPDEAFAVISRALLIEPGNDKARLVLQALQTSGSRTPSHSE